MLKIGDRIKVGLYEPPYNTFEPSTPRVYFDDQEWAGLQAITYSYDRDGRSGNYFSMRYNIEDEETMLSMAYILVDEGFNVELIENATFDIIELYRKDGNIVIEEKLSARR